LDRFQKQLGKRKDPLNLWRILCVEKLNKFELLLCFFGFLARGFVFWCWQLCIGNAFGVQSILCILELSELCHFCLDSLCFFLLNWNWVLFVF
jgi:hypothetical protein